jgi:membrane-bound lytic murein transglycosylase A
LYSMQIQGSGKIRLPEGGTLRLAFAEQNGRPFRPSGVASAGHTNKHRITTRGLSIDLPDDEDDVAPSASDPREVAEPLTRGRRASAPAAVSDADVELMIDLLARGGQGSGQGSKQGGLPNGKPAAASLPAAPIPPTTARPESPPTATPRPARAESTPAEPMTFALPSAQALAAISADPSYVFFREIPDGPGGPIGALGVPLTAGRSVAVDPRTTPLGFPVFLATSRPGDKSQFNRLMMAQDTGGAIRGAVRADYFWGFGADAYAQATRMKESGRMWLLMPAGQQVAARDQAQLTRGNADPAAMPDCVVADPELCVEDR